VFVVPLSFYLVVVTCENRRTAGDTAHTSPYVQDPPHTHVEYGSV
jgi:hypothetical protein